MSSLLFWKNKKEWMGNRHAAGWRKDLATTVYQNIRAQFTQLSLALSFADGNIKFSFKRPLKINKNVFIHLFKLNFIIA